MTPRLYISVVNIRFEELAPIVGLQGLCFFDQPFIGEKTCKNRLRPQPIIKLVDIGLDSGFEFLAERPD